MPLNKEVVVYDVYENTYRRGTVFEDGLFLNIEVHLIEGKQRAMMYSYPKRDIDSGEFIVYVKE